jgi:hypothetical protein
MDSTSYLDRYRHLSAVDQQKNQLIEVPAAVAPSLLSHVPG